jgi:hypothetical protein
MQRQEIDYENDAAMRHIVDTYNVWSNQFAEGKEDLMFTWENAWKGGSRVLLDNRDIGIIVLARDDDEGPEIITALVWPSQNTIWAMSQFFGTQVSIIVNDQEIQKRD